MIHFYNIFGDIGLVVIICLILIIFIGSFLGNIANSELIIAIASFIPIIVLIIKSYW